VKGHLCRGDDLESHVHTVKKRKRRLSTRSHSTYKTHPTSLVIWQIDQSHRNLALDVQKNWSLSMQTMAYLSSFFSAYREDVKKRMLALKLPPFERLSKVICLVQDNCKILCKLNSNISDFIQTLFSIQFCWQPRSVTSVNRNLSIASRQNKASKKQLK